MQPHDLFRKEVRANLEMLEADVSRLKEAWDRLAIAKKAAEARFH